MTPWGSVRLKIRSVKAERDIDAGIGGLDGRVGGGWVGRPVEIYGWLGRDRMFKFFLTPSVHDGQLVGTSQLKTTERLR